MLQAATPTTMATPCIGMLDMSRKLEFPLTGTSITLLFALLFVNTSLPHLVYSWSAVEMPVISPHSLLHCFLLILFLFFLLFIYLYLLLGEEEKGKDEGMESDECGCLGLEVQI